MTAARREQPDICLIDIRMPGGGIRATAKIVSALPDTTVVMYTVSQSDADLFDVLRAGASGYLLKDTDVSPVTVRTHISSILKKLGRAFTASRHEPTGGSDARQGYLRTGATAWGGRVTPYVRVEPAALPALNGPPQRGGPTSARP